MWLATASTTDLIACNWDDLLRVGGSLKLGVISGKTIHLLDLVDNETYRRA